MICYPSPPYVRMLRLRAERCEFGIRRFVQSAGLGSRGQGSRSSSGLLGHRCPDFCLAHCVSHADAGRSLRPHFALSLLLAACLGLRRTSVDAAPLPRSWFGCVRAPDAAVGQIAVASKLLHPLNSSSQEAREYRGWESALLAGFQSQYRQ